MTATLDDVTPGKKRPEPSAEEQAAAELVRLAKEQGLSLTGPDGLRKQLTKTVMRPSPRRPALPVRLDSTERMMA
jgi:putative transposase